jgi:hypothetical protein
MTFLAAPRFPLGAAFPFSLGAAWFQRFSLTGR